MKKFDIIIIGAGHNGLIAACVLSKKGKKVLLIEKNEKLGGLANYSENLSSISQEVLKEINITVEKYTKKHKNQKVSLTDTSFVLILKKRASDAGLEDCQKISGHSLRIGSITQARMNGVPIHEIMAQSGHKTTQMIDRYTKLSNIRETSAAKKI